MDKVSFKQNVTTDSRGCWIWNGKPMQDGYGRLQSCGKSTRAHRLAYELFVGPIPDGLFVCHKCDVRNCVNPEHLFVGTNNDNMMDAYRKGRIKTAPGQGAPRNKSGQPRRYINRQLIIEKHQSGLTVHEIAKAAECSFASVVNVLKPLGVLKKRYLTKAERAEVRILAKSMTHKSIALKYGVSRPSITMIVSGKTRIDGRH